MSNPKVRFLVNLAFYATIITLFFLALQNILPLIMPFVVAFVVAAIIQPVTRFCNKHLKLPKKLCSALFILLFYGTIGVGLVYLFIWLISELVGFVNTVPTYLNDLAATIEASSQEDIADFFSVLPSWLSTPLEQFVVNLSEDVPGKLTEYAELISKQIQLSSLWSVGTNTIGKIIDLLLNIPGIIVVVVVTIIATFFIGLDYDGLTDMIMKAFPKRARPTVEKVKRYTADTVVGLLKTYILLMTLTFAELALGFAAINLIGEYIGIKIEYVVLLALLIAFVDILPVLGVGAVLIPWALVDFLIGEWQLGTMLLVLYIIIIIIRNYLEPKIIGTKYGMHPLITLVAIYIGGKLFGVVGIFALPLTLIICKRLYDVGAIKKPFDDSDNDNSSEDSDTIEFKNNTDNNTAEAENAVENVSVGTEG